MKIRLEYPEMEILIKQLHTEEEVFNQCVSKMEVLVNSVPEMWEGQASIAYISEFNQLKPSFQKTLELMELLQIQIRNTMQLMKAKDLEIAKKIGY